MRLSRGTAYFLVLALLISVKTLAQTVKHTVTKGETITQIAQKYKVTPYDIYRLNPDAQVGIKENDVILVPSSAKTAQQAKTVSSPAKSSTHTAIAKETLYSISKKYNVTVDQLKAANPSLVDGLKVGQLLIIPGGTNNAPAAIFKPAETKPARVVEMKNVISHIVEPKETKFGIAKKYGITVAELERQNPAIVQSLPVGFNLSIGTTGSAPANVEKPKPAVTQIETPSTDKTEIIRTVKRTGFANYEVKPKETIFSLTQMLDTTEAELIELNPTLKDGLKVGMILKVPAKGSMVSETLPAKGFEDLTKSVSAKNKKQLVLLLPFNATRIQGDTMKTLAIRLKKDAFLNMTLDFYSGALMAIDSAKTLGLNIDVKIYDSEESKASSSVANLIQRNDILSANAVIGPFYQQYAEKVAELLSVNNVPVISPLSKESGKAYPNLYQAMPSADYTKSAIFNYMISKNGNIVVVSDPKKASNREFITQNYPQARFLELDDNGSVNADKLRAMFVKDRMNFVVIDSEKTGMILNTTNVLLNEMANFQLQLAIIEQNETLDFDEISMKRLTILKLLYPSITRENITPESVVFENAYKKQNKIFPSQYATRGFDITFDTMLRLSQEIPFSESATVNKTEQVESKFDYVSKPNGGFINNGVYILQYNEDLSVTEAK